MTRTIRVLRIALPIAFVVFVAVIILSYRGNRNRTRVAGEPIPTTTVAGGRPQLVAYTFEDTQTVGGRVVSRIRAKRTIGFTSGWYTLEDVELTIFRKNGQTYVLRCPSAEFEAETKQAEVKGGVKLTSSDGVEISTAEMKFDGAHLVNQMPVDFKVDQWSGRAGHVDVSVEQETMTMGDDFDATLASKAPNEPPVVVHAKQALLDRGKKKSTFDGGVVITRGIDRFESANVVAAFDQTLKILVGLEGGGGVNAAISQGVASPGATGGATRMHCDRFYSELGPDGAIRAVNFVGESNPATAVFMGTPQRNLTATLFRLAFEGSTLKEIKAEKNAVLTEPSTQRRLSAGWMFLYFDPATRKATSSVLAVDVRISDPKSEATGQRADYDIVGDHMLLTSVPGAPPTLRNENQSLKATTIDVSPKEGVLRATGAVISRLESASKGQPSASDTAIFPKGSGPVFVNADSLVVRQATKVALFSGRVRAWQDNNVLIANELQVSEGGETLEARGGTRTNLYNTGGKAASKTPVVSRSDRLIAKKTARTVTLDGHVTMDDDSRHLAANQATLFFDAKQTLSRTEATGNVSMEDKSTARKGSGDKLVYRVTEKMIDVEGSPATMSDERGTIKGRKIEFDLTRNKVEVVSGETPTEATYNPKQ